MTSGLVLGGAELIAEPTVTPLQSLDSRLSAPADLQITVLEELDGRGPERTPARPFENRKRAASAPAAQPVGMT